MANNYTKEERIEAIKLAEEIGTPAAAQRLGIKEDIEILQDALGFFAQGRRK